MNEAILDLLVQHCQGASANPEMAAVLRARFAASAEKATAALAALRLKPVAGAFCVAGQMHERARQLSAGGAISYEAALDLAFRQLAEESDTSMCRP